MTADEKATLGDRNADPGRRGDSPSPGYGSLARRITRWTTNGLVSAVVLIAGLGFGRTVVRWWAEERHPEPVASLPAAFDPMGDPATMHELEFGDQRWGLARRSVVAPPEAVLAELRADCRTAIPKARLPVDAPGAEECGLLERIAACKPVLVESGVRFYELDGPFPMVVGTRSALEDSVTTAGQQLAASTDRVVIWGLAMPTAERQWTLYTFHGVDSTQGAPSEPSELPLPRSARRVLSMSAAGGGRMVCFRGAGAVASWKSFFEEWFRQRGFLVQGGWNAVGLSWHARACGNAAPREATVWDVQFGPDPEGTLTGLLVMTPHPRQPQEGTRR